MNDRATAEWQQTATRSGKPDTEWLRHISLATESCSTWETRKQNDRATAEWQQTATRSGKPDTE